MDVRRCTRDSLGRIARDPPVGLLECFPGDDQDDVHFAWFLGGRWRSDRAAQGPRRRGRLLGDPGRRPRFLAACQRTRVHDFACRLAVQRGLGGGLGRVVRDRRVATAAERAAEEQGEQEKGHGASQTHQHPELGIGEAGGRRNGGLGGRRRRRGRRRRWVILQPLGLLGGDLLVRRQRDALVPAVLGQIGPEEHGVAAERDRPGVVEAGVVDLEVGGGREDGHRLGLRHLDLVGLFGLSLGHGFGRCLGGLGVVVAGREAQEGREAQGQVESLHWIVSSDSFEQWVGAGGPS